MKPQTKFDSNDFGVSLALSQLEATDRSFILMTATEDSFRIEFRTTELEEVGEMLAAAQLEYDKLLQEREDAQ